MNSVPQIFDRRKIAHRQQRAHHTFSDYDFLYREVALRLLDRLNDFSRRFEKILVVGAGHGLVKDFLCNDFGYNPENITVIDMIDAPLVDVIADEEVLPFGAETFDCVISCLSLPFVNDVPGVMAQINYALKKDGVFLAASLGTLTLHELRESLMKADIEIYGGAGNRVAPFLDIVDATALMQRVKFALPVVDQDLITVSYPDIYRLMQDLKGMGVSDPLYGRQNVKATKRFFDRAANIYAADHADEGGRIKASFEILYLTGWRPDASQQQPLKPGSAQNRLAEALNVGENALSDIAKP